MENTTYTVYILYSERADLFYIGNTALPVTERLEQHNEGQHQRAASKRGIPWKVHLTLSCTTRLQARRVELHIKRMKSKRYVANLTAYPEMQQRLVARYETLEQ